MIVRHLEYLTALARERHFARAAAACHVTQPSLSAGIKQLEKSLGVLIVERRQKFVGLTAEGERVLGWAQRVLADYASLEQQLQELSGELRGPIRIGAVPVSLPVLALLTTPFARSHPGARFRLTSQTPSEIQRGLDDFTLDAGVTHLDGGRLDNVRTQPLYRERYVLVTQPQHSTQRPGRERKPPRERTRITWAEAAKLPLCLLTSDLQDRGVMDLRLQQAGADVPAVLETNNLITLWSHIHLGGFSSIVPHTFLLLLGRLDGLVALPLVEPDASHLVGLAVRDMEPLPPLAQSLLQHAQSLDLAAEIERRVAFAAAPPGV